MNRHTVRQLVLLVAALELGVLGEGLLRAVWGINWGLWMAAVIATAFAMARTLGVALPAARRRALLATVALAGLWSWRDSGTLLLMALIAWFWMLGQSLPRPGRAGFWNSGIADQLEDLRFTFRTLLARVPALLLKEIPWREVGTGTQGQWTAVVRGLVVAVPLGMVFGVLFVAADQRFEQLVSGLFRWDLNLFLFVHHGLVIGLLSLFSGGLLLAVAIDGADAGAAQRHPARQPAQPPWTLSSPIEIGIILGSLNLLFLAFILVQLSYFFGGSELVLSSEGPTYAEYARRGFFELAIIVLLVLSCLLGLEWMLDPERRDTGRVFGRLAVALLCCVTIVMASAAHRMALYQAAYGWTELRWYASAFMCWLAWGLIWFAATVLRSRRPAFAPGMLVAGLVWLLALYLLNPDARIAQNHLDRATEGRSWDVQYISAELSDDSIPTVIAGMGAIPSPGRCLWWNFLQSKRAAGEPDWRSWNWSRQRARAAIAAYEPTGKALNCPPVTGTVTGTVTAPTALQAGSH